MTERKDRRYVVVKEHAFDWCRLRLADRPDVEGLEVFWSGNSLRAGYDAMIRINRRHRPADICHLMVNDRNRYRIFKESSSRERDASVYGSSAPDGWNPVRSCSNYREARAALADAAAERNEERGKRLAGRDTLIAELRAVHVRTGKNGRIPKLDERSLKYLDTSGNWRGWQIYDSLVLADGGGLT